MTLQAYIDDSTGPSGVFVLAGYIAPTNTWADFTQEWEEMLRFGVRNANGDFHFKMSEMALNTDRMERVGAFWRIIQKYKLQGISCKINKLDLHNAILRLWSLDTNIDWGPWKDPFVFTFRALIDNIHSHRELFPSLDPNEKIDFIFDNQSQKNIILPAWDKFIQERPMQIKNLYGATPRFEDDRNFLPLQAADLWAWWVRKWYEENCPTVLLSGKVQMATNGLITDSGEVHSTLISYDEDKIAENMRLMVHEVDPTVILYDSKMIKEL